jgi:CHASE3 domain sensor protein
MRLYLIPFGLLALLAGLTLYMAFSHSVEMRESQRWVGHTYRVIDAGQRVFVGMQDLENGTRSFILTGDASYRRAYVVSSQLLDRRLEELDRLVLDNPQQAMRARALRGAVAVRVASLTSAFEMAGAGQQQAAVDLIHAGRSGDEIGPVRSLAREIVEEERRLLTEHSRLIFQGERLGAIPSRAAASFGVAPIGFIPGSLGRSIQPSARQPRSTAKIANA